MLEEEYEEEEEEEEEDEETEEESVQSVQTVRKETFKEYVKRIKSVISDEHPDVEFIESDEYIIEDYDNCALNVNSLHLFMAIYGAYQTNEIYVKTGLDTVSFEFFTCLTRRFPVVSLELCFKSDDML